MFYSHDRMDSPCPSSVAFCWNCRMHSAPIVASMSLVVCSTRSVNSRFASYTVTSPGCVLACAIEACLTMMTLMRWHTLALPRLILIIVLLTSMSCMQPSTVELRTKNKELTSKVADLSQKLDAVTHISTSMPDTIKQALRRKAEATTLSSMTCNTKGSCGQTGKHSAMSWLSGWGKCE